MKNPKMGNAMLYWNVDNFGHTGCWKLKKKSGKFTPDKINQR